MPSKPKPRLLRETAAFTSKPRPLSSTEMDGGLLRADADRGEGCSGMLEDVVRALLHDAVNAHLGLWAEEAIDLIDVGLDRESIRWRELFSMERKAFVGPSRSRR